ncbi:MAG: phosphoribosylanthranilate isomerase [Steroidobacteraceae bacterium]
MTIWIKICGLTTTEAVEAAVAAGADAIGFVFAPSQRQVSAARAAELAQRSSSGVLKVAVMQHPSQSAFDEVWSVFRPDLLQTDFDDLAMLRVPAELSVLPVLRGEWGGSGKPPARVLFEGAKSGAGLTSDWSAAAVLARETQLVLAGGLDPSNVASAIDAVRPHGVDVRSGVEAAPGVKDPRKIHEFVRRARAAAIGA